MFAMMAAIVPARIGVSSLPSYVRSLRCLPPAGVALLPCPARRPRPAPSAVPGSGMASHHPPDRPARPPSLTSARRPVPTALPPVSHDCPCSDEARWHTILGGARWPTSDS